jgi:hypothetical protein
VALNRHHHRALGLLGVTAVAVVVMGFSLGTATHLGPLHGIYCTTGFATTAGCDIPLHGRLQYGLGELSMILMIPLYSAVFSFLTTALTADHLERKFHVKRKAD